MGRLSIALLAIGGMLLSGAPAVAGTGDEPSAFVCDDNTGLPVMGPIAAEATVTNVELTPRIDGLRISFDYEAAGDSEGWQDPAGTCLMIVDQYGAHVVPVLARIGPFVAGESHHYDADFDIASTTHRILILARNAIPGCGMDCGSANMQVAWWGNVDVPPRLATLTTATPTISGTAKAGATLTAQPGKWNGDASFAYQWLAGGQPIPGATARTLTLAGTHVGRRISVVVTGSLEYYETASRTSKEYGPVAAGTLAASVPAISGAPAVGSTVTAKPGTWTAGTAHSYQWYADGKAISKATGSAFTVAAAQQGKKLSVKVTGKKAGYTTTSKTSKQTAKAPKVATPKTTGTAAVGSKVTAKPGTWTSGTQLSYQWYADGTAISKATKSTLTVAGGQVGKSITVKVTGKKSGYATVSKTSKGTTRVPKTATPSISGSKLVTQKLTASPGTWTAGTAFTYQWYANAKAISGATKPTLTLTSGHGGKKITVKVTGKKSGYTTVSKTSKATSAIGYPSRAEPASLTSCPSWAPIKGNADSGIYHLPGQRFYTATHPEVCFRTEKAAVGAGYRKAKV